MRSLALIGNTTANAADSFARVVSGPDEDQAKDVLPVLFEYLVRFVPVSLHQFSPNIIVEHSQAVSNLSLYSLLFSCCLVCFQVKAKIAGVIMSELIGRRRFLRPIAHREKRRRFRR